MLVDIALELGVALKINAAIKVLVMIRVAEFGKLFRTVGFVFCQQLVDQTLAARRHPRAGWLTGQAHGPRTRPDSPGTSSTSPGRCRPPATTARQTRWRARNRTSSVSLMSPGRRVAFPSTAPTPPPRQQRQQDHQQKRRGTRQQPQPMPGQPTDPSVGRCRTGRRLLSGNLKAGKRRRQIRRLRGEGVLRLVPGDLAAGEFLRDDFLGDRLIAQRRTQFAGRPEEFVPRGLDRPAHHECAVVRGPEDHRLVVGGEGAHLAGRFEPAVSLVGDREAEVAVCGSAERLVLGQDVGLDGIGAGGGAEEDLSTGEILGQPVAADRILVTLFGAQRTGGAAGGPPGHIDVCGRIDRYLQVRRVGRPGRAGRW